MNKHGQFCYTYLLGWRKLDVWYYGARGQNKQPPAQDLMNDYPTSSKYVKEFIEDHGPPDVVRVHKLFTDYKSAREHESKFLKRVNADRSSRWLNRHTGPGNYITSGPRLRSTIEKISKANTGKKRSPETRKLMSEKRKAYMQTDEGKAHNALMTRNRIENDALRGKPRSKESVEKMTQTIRNQFKNGRIVHNKGKPCSPEQKERLSNLRKGVEQTDDHKKQNSERVKLWWAMGRPKGGLKNLA